MNKVAPILLMLIYSMSSFGVGIKQFYCCGKLKSTDITLVQDDVKEKCNKGGMGDCCKTKFKSFKVKDIYIASENIVDFNKYFTDFHLPIPSFEIATFTIVPMAVANTSHAPPLHKGVAIYILNCTYRI